MQAGEVWGRSDSDDGALVVAPSSPSAVVEGHLAPRGNEHRCPTAVPVAPHFSARKLPSSPLSCRTRRPLRCPNQDTVGMINWQMTSQTQGSAPTGIRIQPPSLHGVGAEA